MLNKGGVVLGWYTNRVGLWQVSVEQGCGYGELVLNKGGIMAG